MEAFLALIDDKEIEMAEAIVPEDFTKNVMKNIENIRPIKKNQRKKKHIMISLYIMLQWHLWPLS